MTMWEDLGEKAVLAMGNASSATQKTTDNLKEVQKLTFDDLYSQLAQIFRPMETDIAGKLSSFIKENETQIRTIAQSLADGVLKAMQWILDNKDTILSWAKSLGTAFLVFKVGGVVGNGLKGIIYSFKAIGKVASALHLDKALSFLGGKGLKGLKVFSKFIGSTFLKSLSLLKAGFLRLIPVVWNFTIALLANPITWIIAGIIALGVGIYALVKHWDAVKEAFSTAGAWFYEYVITPVVSFFKWLGTSIANAFVAAWNWIKSVWSAVTSWFNEQIIQPVINFFVGLCTSIANAFVAAWNWIKSVWSAVTSWFNEWIIQPVMSFFVGLCTSIYNAFVAAWNWIKSVWSAVTAWFSTNIINPIITKFNSVKSSIGQAFSTAWNLASSIWGKAASWFEKNVSEPIKKIFGSLKEGWEKTKEGFSTVTSKVTGAAKAVGGFIGIPGMANGGVFEPKNPFLAVLGDQKRGNNIEAPEGLLRNIVREESYGYTPQSTISSSKSTNTENNTYNPVFNINISGSIDNRNTERKIKEIFKKSMDEYAQSLMRKSPRVTSV